MTYQYILELLGTAFFSVSGALIASKRSSPDWFGVTFISFITATGGGSIRDILLGDYPLGWISDVNIIFAVLAGILIAALFFSSLQKLRKLFFVFDSLGIAMFTTLGVEKALQFDVNPVIAAILGMFSAVMGGVLRDILSSEVPIIFRKEIYATACLGGAFLYLLMDKLGFERIVCISIASLFIFTIRYFAVKYHWSLPQFRSKAQMEGDE
jgi:uncharacterized membrane protein YeiH